MRKDAVPQTQRCEYRIDDFLLSLRLIQKRTGLPGSENPLERMQKLGKFNRIFLLHGLVGQS